MQKPLAEFIGTFTLVLFGCGAAVIAGEQIGVLGISFAFGLALIAMAYGFGPVSGKLAGHDIAKAGLGQNGWGQGYLGEYGLVSAFVFEIVATFLFLVTILGVTVRGATAAVAGLAIGLALVVIHIVGIQVTGVSVNPARSLGPALFAGAGALS